jgi:hypothetical protein
MVTSIDQCLIMDMVMKNLVAFSLFALALGDAAAQGLDLPGPNGPSSVGGTNERTSVPGTQMIEGSQSTLVMRHRGPTGKPCLNVFGSAQRQLINTNLYDHMIMATNSCVRAIKVDVCYYGTDHCISMQVPAMDRKQAMLGVLPAMKDFRFEFREQFTGENTPSGR